MGELLFTPGGRDYDCFSSIAPRENHMRRELVRQCPEVDASTTTNDTQSGHPVRGTALVPLRTNKPQLPPPTTQEKKIRSAGHQAGVLVDVVEQPRSHSHEPAELPLDVQLLSLGRREGSAAARLSHLPRPARQHTRARAHAATWGGVGLVPGRSMTRSGSGSTTTQKTSWIQAGLCLVRVRTARKKKENKRVRKSTHAIHA